jgi:hypothetical protein
LKDGNLAYKIIPKIEGYVARKGLEGPFNFDGRVLYYDPIEGKYYDPRTDFYVPHSEYFEIVGLMVK